MKSKDTFNPFDANGNELETYTCTFDGQGSCEVKITGLEGRYDSTAHVTPKILYKKGQKKQNVNNRLINALNESPRVHRRPVCLSQATLPDSFKLS